MPYSATEPGGTVNIPMGMVMALAENPAAMTAFAALPDRQVRDLIRAARLASSHDQVRIIVNALAEM